MKKISAAISLLLVLSILLCFAGCSASSSSNSDTDSQSVAPSEESSDTLTIVDHNDNTVTVPKNIERIVVCDILPLPSVLAVFFDSADKIVGMSNTSMAAAENGLLGELYPEILQAETGFISGSEVNVEELLKLNPDVVFYNAASSALGDQLRTAGFNAVAISTNKWNYNCIETLNQWIALLSELFPDNDKTETVENYSNDIYNMIQERTGTLSEEEKAKVFFLFKYEENTMMTSGQQFFGQWWADAIGAKNVSEELTQDNQVTVSMEQVYQWNPEIVFITNFTAAMPEDLYNNTVGSYDWSGISAVEKQQVCKMPLGMYRSYTPGADTPVTLLWLAKTVYPDLFADIDITQYTIDYYQSVFGITLTETQAESIFAPPAAAGAGFKE